MAYDLEALQDQRLPKFIGDENGQLVQVGRTSPLLQSIPESMASGDPLTWLAMMGRVFYASDAAQGDTVLGQTSYSITTPTFLLDVPQGVVCAPLLARLSQAGASPAGGAITVIVEADVAKSRRASGGTAEKSYNLKTKSSASWCTLYTNPTASAAGYGIRLDSFFVGPDISTAEGAVNKIVWAPFAGLDWLVGPASLLIYTYAATTGPTWLWSVKWAEFQESDWPQGLAL